MTFVARGHGKSKPIIDKEIAGWPRGYMSSGDVPEDALADMTNWDLDELNRPTIRWPLVPYGADMVGTCIGVGTFQKDVSGTPERWEISMQAVQTNEVQKLRITGSPTGGTFTLTYSGQTTAAIAYNAAASAVQSALIALSNIGPSDVVCTGGGLPGNEVIITFGGALANTDVPTITSTSSLTGGTSPAITITERAKGGLRGVVYIRKDGGAWTAPDTTVHYDPEATVEFVHSNDRVDIFNGEDRMSYYDIVAGNIVVYDQVADPVSGPTLAATGLTGSATTLYYAYAECTKAGETLPSPVQSQAVSLSRESWDGTTKYLDVTLPAAPANVTSRNIYVGPSALDIRLVGTINSTATTFRDDGRSLAEVSKRPSLANSTGGPITKYGVNILGQVFTWGGEDNLVHYDGGAEGPQGSGNFTISGGGGYIGADQGPTIPMAVVPFRTGKGDPVPSIIYRGSAGEGAFRHLGFVPQTIGDLTALMPVITEANGRDGTVSPRAVVLLNNSVHFPTGAGFKFYGSAPNIPNILSPNSSSDFIIDKVRQLNFGAMDKAMSVEFEGRGYFALPVLSNENSEIWVLDTRSNPAKWIIPWKIPAKFIWKYEDNSGENGGVTHLCVLVNNKVLEFNFNKTTLTEDDGEAFRTRLASGPLKWSKSGSAIGYIDTHTLNLLKPRGKMHTHVHGLDVGNNPIDRYKEVNTVVTTPATGFGQFVWGEDEFGEDPGNPAGSAVDLLPVPIPVGDTVSRITWEVTTEDSDCGGTLSSTFTDGKVIPKLYAGR